MQRNSGPTFANPTPGFDTVPFRQPVHICTSTEDKRLIAKDRRQELRSRRTGYRRGWTSAALRIDKDNRASPKPQERCQHTHDIDKEAASLVEHCFKQRRETRLGRTLRKRLNHELDLGLSSIIQSLDAILDAADRIFFSRKLRNRVEWRWSSESDQGFVSEFVGTTTPIYSEEFGTKAEIVLSRPLLQSGQYSSNLLLSAFLHELVHCYLFISCGQRAEEDGGHTPGFQRIVSLIQSWLGNPKLRLCSMRADLDNFLPEPEDQEQEDDWHLGDPVYSEYSTSPAWGGESDMYPAKPEEDVQAGFARTLNNMFPPSWEETSWTSCAEPFWADTPRMGYVSRQELAGAIEGSASMPILVE